MIIFSVRDMARLPPMADGTRSNKDIGRRLVMLYESMGMNQTSFAHLIGVGQSAMSNYQGGTRRPDPDVAITIQMKTGATLDWIYTGERGGLPGNLLQKLPDWDETLPERRPAKPRKR